MRAKIKGYLAGLSGLMFAVAPPNDTLFGEQWSLSNDGSQSLTLTISDTKSIVQPAVPGVDIGWLDAWTQVSSLAQQPVTIAVIDYGVDLTHEDLQGRISTDAWDFLANAAGSTDDDGHGTQVTGIAVANTGNAIGVAGIAPPKIQVLPLRILSKYFTTFRYNGTLISDYAAAAVQYAIDHHASVINMSFGWPKLADSAQASAAVQRAIDAGILVVAAAGNNRKEVPTFPCAYEGVLCVGATSNNGQSSVYSNWGGRVDLTAPGDGILSTYPAGYPSTEGIDGYERLSGTSQATPIVSAIAAILKSANPAISLNELKARLLSSGPTHAATLPDDGSVAAARAAFTPSGQSLYPMVHLQGTLDALPQPVFLPDFRQGGEALVDNTSLLVQGSVPVENLWQTATQVGIQALVNGQPAGSVAIASLGAGELVQVPWKYQFKSLDEGNTLHLTLQVSAAGFPLREFSTDVTAVRPLLSVPVQTRLALVAPGGLNVPWIGLDNGHPYTGLIPISSYQGDTGAGEFYQVLGSTASGSTIALVSPTGAQPVSILSVPGIVTIKQVVALDANGDGKLDRVVIGKTSSAAGAQELAFYFVDSSLQPLYGTVSLWQVPLDAVSQQGAAGNFAKPGSWIRYSSQDPRLLPCFPGTGPLPPPDNFGPLDPRHNETRSHLYYLEPQATQAGATSTSLVLRAIDNASFSDSRPELAFLAPLPVFGTDLSLGKINWLIQSDPEGPIQLWTVSSVKGSQPEDMPGWNSVTAKGDAFTALPGGTSALTYFIDSTKGYLTWTSASGVPSGTTDFSFEGIENPVSGFIGAFSLPGTGRYWFAEANFDLLAFHQPPGNAVGTWGAVETKTLPINRDSSFSAQQFNLLFAPVLVGTAAQPLPGVFIDTVEVQENHVSVATWSGGTLGTPLRYSLQIPDLCVPLPPGHLDATPESFTISMVCNETAQGAGVQTVLRMVRPTLSR